MTHGAGDVHGSHAGTYPTEVDGHPEAGPPALVELADGDSFDLAIGPVRKRLGTETVRMLAYNGSIPGPTLRVAQGSRVRVRVANGGDLETTVHWHGLRLDNAFDGTHETQPPIRIGETFAYEVEFPDPGVYWYHPHIREDYAQELGLYGNIVVVPADPGYWPPVDRELVLTLDDLLVEDGAIAGFRRSEPTFVAMGRFGNVMLVSGSTDFSLAVGRDEIVRLYLTNTANARVFNVTLSGARMKLVGGDSGRVEREELVDEVLLAPSERAVVDVLFTHAGETTLEHRSPEGAYALGRFSVDDGPPAPASAERFAALRTNADMLAERARIQPYLSARPDKTLAFVAEMDVPPPEDHAVFSCPMHPEVRSATAGRCPTCGMKLVPAAVVMEDVHKHHAAPGGAHDGPAGRIEWEDGMVEVNRETTPATTRWKLVDTLTGAENTDIDWRFRVGDQVKIRLVNEMRSDHPMPHPFHVHGAGRFLILARDGAVETNLAWKDTVLVRTGETVDILLDVTHEGRWMAHCHIAEHNEGGMALSFRVDGPGGG